MNNVDAALYKCKTCEEPLGMQIIKVSDADGNTTIEASKLISLLAIAKATHFQAYRHVV